MTSRSGKAPVFEDALAGVAAGRAGHTGGQEADDKAREAAAAARLMRS